MNKSQVFKVKGMHRDLSMPNANGEFAYEIVNMRLTPAEEGAGFSLTNERGLIANDVSISGNVLLGQCSTSDSLIVFSKDTKSTYKYDYIERLYHDGLSWVCETLYQGNLNFREGSPIETLFNYETEDIQKVYWIDGVNQLRCINIADTSLSYNDTSFDSIKEIDSVPRVKLSLSAGGKFTAGVLQYYITYFNKFSSESPIMYTSPLLHIAHDGRGGNTNDSINTAYRLRISDLDNSTWEYIRIYATHRTSLEATPEGSIVAELKIPNTKSIDFTDYGSGRISIDPNELHFVGGKCIVAGTMTAKDQVLFLGNLKIDTNKTINYDAINSLFANLRANGTIDTLFSTSTTKTKSNKLSEYEDTYYYYKSNLNNTEPITHYKYGEKYRFGISLMDTYGNWSNPIWIKDAFITVAPKQINGDTLALPCPQLELLENIPGQSKSLWDFLKENGAISIKPLVVFPSIDERKVLAQGVVCPTVYNLKDRKENGPYAQASWFMRPNAPIDLWNLTGTYDTWLSEMGVLVHNSDVIFPESTQGYNIRSYQSILNPNSNATKWLDTKMSLVYDDLSISRLTENYENSSYANGYGSRAAIKAGTSIFNEDIIFYPKDYYNSLVDDGKQPYALVTNNFDDIAKDIVSSGSWVEFRHNYALRTKGWTWGPTNDWYQWNAGIEPEEILDYEWMHDKYLLMYKNYSPIKYPFPYLYRSLNAEPSTYPKKTTGIVTMGPQDGVNYNHAIYFKFRLGASRCAELDTSRFGATIPVNRFCGDDIGRNTWRNVPLVRFNTGNSAYYVDNSIVTFHSPEVEVQEDIVNITPEGYDFRIIGVVPLTATISDISLEYSGSIYDPSINTEVEFGLKKNLVRNKNIGHHGFKGLVTHSTLFSGHNAPNSIEYDYKNDGTLAGVTANPLYSDYYAANFPLHPWQSTGNIPGFDPTWAEKGNYTTLKRKILSNLRYSANSCFYNLKDLGTGTLSDNEALLSAADNKSMGWKPYRGSNIQLFNSTEQSIVKLNLDGYNSDLVYSANIDSIALATAGENTPIPIYSYFYGRKLAPTDSIETSGYTPYIGGACFDDVYKTGIGSSIKYKSSPHAVIGFNAVPVTIEGALKWTQEILPSFSGVNLASKNYQSIDQIGQLTEEQAGYLYEDDNIISIPHQSSLSVDQFSNFGLPGYNAINSKDKTPNYGWLWLGELYKLQDPTFGGNSEYALQNNSWEVGGTYNSVYSFPINGYVTTTDGIEHKPTFTIERSNELELLFYLYGRDSYRIIFPELITESVREFIKDETKNLLRYTSADLLAIKNNSNFINFSAAIRFIKSGYKIDLTIDTLSNSFEKISKVAIYFIDITNLTEGQLKWTIGDTYYQRFDTLKTYAYSDEDENSIVDITSFMVETRVNIDGRYDRNRGQDSNLQMSPTNFNLINDAYSQRDNFFTYRILDKDIQSRTEFPNQITWSLSKTAGATVDAWMNHTLASVLDLDGTKGNLTALKTFGDQIISFQETGISAILFNSRVQIPTSEYVPIQIANSGKVDGQQYLTTDLGCQDKWNIVTTPSGLYFVDYYNKSIYRFNGKVEDLSTVGGFRGWCDSHLYDGSQVLGYYDKKNREVLFYSSTFGQINNIETHWLGFSEITNTFSSFYTFPKAALSNVRDRQIWLVYDGKYNENEAKYENVYTYYSDVYGKSRTVPESSYPYGLTAIVRQDSNIVKTFNSVEFRADTYRSFILQNNETFDTIQIEDEYNGKTSESLEHKKYKPSNLKKLLRTWRAYIPRVDNKTKRYVNQWAKVGLWKTKSTQEKTVLHDMSVWYSE